MTIEELPFLCNFCGTRYGFGGAERLLAVVSEMPFEEPLPCCGVKVRGIAVLGSDGYVEIKELAEVKP